MSGFAAVSQIIFVFDDKPVLESRFQPFSLSVPKILNLSDASDFDKLMSIAIKLSNTGDAASTNETYVFRGADHVLTTIVLVMLPIAASRHNSPARPHALTNAIKGKKTDEDTIVYLLPSEDYLAYAQILAAGRAFPNFSMKRADTTRNVESKVHIVVEFPVKETAEVLSEAANTLPYVRLASQLVDTPPNILHSESYIAIVREVAAELGTAITVIQGKELEERGLGGIWSVGKAAEHLPALVILSYVPPTVQPDDASICFVGKGITTLAGCLSRHPPLSWRE